MLSLIINVLIVEYTKLYGVVYCIWWPEIYLYSAFTTWGECLVFSSVISHVIILNCIIIKSSLLFVITRRTWVNVATS